MASARWIRRPVGARAWRAAGVGALCLASFTDRLEPASAAANAQNADDFLVVDCTLPAKTRKLGRHVTYLAPRRPVRTTALDCGIRGGEYTAHDRADYQTALTVWKSAAEGGSAEAQYYLAKMYEQGRGAAAPDYAQAAAWYRQAAEQGYAAAAVGLGYLYEKGLGVATDGAQALAWYRKAAGLGEDMVVLSESEVEQLRAAQAELLEKERTIRELEERLRELEKQRSAAEAGGEAARAEIETLRGQVSALSRSAGEQRARLAKLAEQLAASPQSEPVVPAAGLDFGPYFALLIGNGSYAHLPTLPSAPREAQAMATLLRERFGFETRVLTDATRYQIMAALNELREKLSEKHNLLVFYAGRSEEDAATQRGWWLPVDAEAGSRANWISVEVVSDHLELIPAKHALVVANASFPAVLTRSSLAQLPRGSSPESRMTYVRQALAKRSRLVLAAGEPPTAAPAAAAASAGSASFGQALLDALAEGGPVVEASALHRRVAARMAQLAEGPAVPQFAPIRWANHQGGADFFFLAKRQAP
jgi:hypothetical protein